MGEYKNRARGMLVGLAVGDALGAPVEFFPSGTVAGEMSKIRHMHNTHSFPKGAWTDDTSMALCLADSLLECGGYDSYDVMDKYLSWRDNGYRSYFSGGYGIGIHTSEALSDYETCRELTSDQETDNAGNGAIMRMAPIVIASCAKPNLRLASVQTRDTHYSTEAEAIAEMFASCLYAAMLGKSKNEICVAVDADFSRPEYKSEYERVKIFLERADDRKGDWLRDVGGYSLDTLTIALWGLTQFDSFLYGMLGVISLGGDTDTNAACYGQLAGAFYGYEGTPEEWRRDVYLSNELVEIADKLLEMESCPIIRTRW